MYVSWGATGFSQERKSHYISMQFVDCVQAALDTLTLTEP